jgi:hypothetical protein
MGTLLCMKSGENKTDRNIRRSHRAMNFWPRQFLTAHSVMYDHLYNQCPTMRFKKTTNLLNCIPHALHGRWEFKEKQFNVASSRQEGASVMYISLPLSLSFSISLSSLFGLCFNIPLLD